MKRGRWDAIDRARKLLGLTEKASRNEIREAYTRACQQCHPDRSDDEDSQDKMAQINTAYRLLMEYSDGYRISFLPNEDGMNDSEWWFFHFGQDPIWGGEKGD